MFSPNTAVLLLFMLMILRTILQSRAWDKECAKVGDPKKRREKELSGYTGIILGRLLEAVLLYIVWRSL